MRFRCRFRDFVKTPILRIIDFRIKEAMIIVIEEGKLAWGVFTGLNGFPGNQEKLI